MIRYLILSEMIAYGIFSLFTSCIIDPGGVVKKPTVTPTALATISPTPRPRLTDIPPYPTATPSPTARPYAVEMPSIVQQCQKFRVSVKGPHVSDDVVIWAEKAFHIGRMFFDAQKDEKYLIVKLSSAGQRVLDFKVNGVWELSHSVLVEPHQENCNLFL